MRPKERRDSGQNDLFRARLDQIVDIDHPLAKLGRAIAWRFLEERFGAVYSDKAGHPPLPTRLMAGLSILKHMHDLSDEDLCARWVENPYYQLFCGEEFFQHQLTFDRSSLTRWRQRMEEERLDGADPGEPCGGPAHRRSEAGRLFQGHRRHDGAAQGGRLSDRREAHASSPRAPGEAGEEDQRRAAPVLRAGKMIQQLASLRGIGVQSATVLVREALLRPRIAAEESTASKASGRQVTDGSER